jgi:predicted deacylase
MNRESSSSHPWYRTKESRAQALQIGVEWGDIGHASQRLIDYGIATGYLRGRTVQRTSG